MLLANDHALASSGWGTHEGSLYSTVFNIDEQEGDGDSLQENTIGLNVEPRVSSRFGRGVDTFISARMFYATETVDFNDDDTAGRTDSFLGLRQAWLSWGGFTDVPGESFVIGRKRLRIDDGLLLDRDISTLAWRFHTSLLEYDIAYAKQLGTFRSDDVELSPLEENVDRLIMHSRWQYHYGHYLSGSFIYGEQDNDELQYDLYWSSLSVNNDFFAYKHRKPLVYNLSLHHVRGDSVLSGVESEVDGRALDAGLRWQLPFFRELSVGAHYHATLGDKGGYRQTGLQSNRSNFTGSRHRLHRFNEAARFLSENLDAQTLTLSYTPNSPWEVVAVFNNLSRSLSDESVFANGIDVPVNNSQSDELGKGMDLVLSWYFDRGDPSLMSHSRIDSFIRLRLSRFEEGAAYGENRSDYFRGVIDWVLKF